VRAMVSVEGAADHQGEMQGILSAVEGLTAVYAPLLTAGLFYIFTAHLLPLTFPGAPFAFASSAAMVAIVLLQQI
jgi:MFS transporter, DHA1 family, tetracycline resistance protein